MLPAAGIEPGTKWFIVSYTHHCAISVLKVSMGCTRFAVFQDTWFNPGTLTEIVYTRSTDIQSAHQLSDSQKCAVIGTCDLQNSLHHAAHNMITAVHPVDAPFKLLYPWAFSELRDHEGKNKSSPAQLGGWESRIFDHRTLECGGTVKNKQGRIGFRHFHAHGRDMDNLNAHRVRLRISGSRCATCAMCHLPSLQGLCSERARMSSCTRTNLKTYFKKESAGSDMVL